MEKRQGEQMFGDFVLLLAMIQLGAVTAITAAVVGAVFLSIDQFQIEALRFAVVPTSSPGKLHELQKQLVGL